MSTRSTRLLVAAGLLVAGLGGYLARGTAEGAEGRYRGLDLAPGTTARVVVRGTAFAIEVPSGPEESASIGTFRVVAEAARFDSGVVPRDGGVEGVWIGDVTGDGAEDAVLVVRSAGSGSYVDLSLLTCAGGAWRLEPVPAPDAAWLAGTMGHDSIDVRGGRLLRTLPTYVDARRLRLDHGWKPGDVLAGEGPLALDPDANSSPSGPDRVLAYDAAGRVWRLHDDPRR